MRESSQSHYKLCMLVRKSHHCCFTNAFLTVSIFVLYEFYSIPFNSIILLWCRVGRLLSAQWMGKVCMVRLVQNLRCFAYVLILGTGWAQRLLRP